MVKSNNLSKISIELNQSNRSNLTREISSYEQKLPFNFFRFRYDILFGVNKCVWEGAEESQVLAHSLRNAANEIKIREKGGGSERAERVSERGEGIASAA